MYWYIKLIIGVSVKTKNKKNNEMLEIPPIKKNFKFSNFFSPKKCEVNNIIKIVKIYTVGVCIERKANKHTKGNKNHKKLFLFFIAIKRLKIASNEKIYACMYAKGVPLSG